MRKRHTLSDEPGLNAPEADPRKPTRYHDHAQLWQEHELDLCLGKEVFPKGSYPGVDV